MWWIFESNSTQVYSCGEFLNQIRVKFYSCGEFMSQIRLKSTLFMNFWIKYDSNLLLWWISESNTIQISRLWWIFESNMTQIYSRGEFLNKIRRKSTLVVNFWLKSTLDVSFWLKSSLVLNFWLKSTLMVSFWLLSTLVVNFWL